MKTSAERIEVTKLLEECMNKLDRDAITLAKAHVMHNLARQHNNARRLDLMTMIFGYRYTNGITGVGEGLAREIDKIVKSSLKP